MKATSATSAGNDHNKSGESQKRSTKAQTKRMVALAFDKLAQLVLQNRVAVDARQREGGAEERPWFNLHVADRESISAETQPWKKDHSRPMHIFVMFAPDGPDGPSQERLLLEHWQCSFTAKTAAIPPNLNVVYAKFVTLFRSLYLQLKILPAYKAFQSALALRRNDKAAAALRLTHQISATPLLTPHPFGVAARPERVEFGKIETAFGVMELGVWYRKDVAFALAERPEVIPAESIIPDYAPSLSSKIPIRPPSSKPMSISAASLSGTRPRSSTGLPVRPLRGTESQPTIRPSRTTEAHSQPSMDHTRLSFSPPTVGAHSVFPAARERMGSEPPYPTFMTTSPRWLVATGAAATHGVSVSPRGSSSSAAVSPGHVGSYSSSPLYRESDTVVDAILSRVSGGLVNSEADRVLTVVSPPSFSMYELALHESPDPDGEGGPVFAIEGSFADDEESAVSAFVRHCQSKPALRMIDVEQELISGPNSPYAQFCSQERADRRKIKL